MRTENTITINAPAARIFALAEDIAAWPRILPHYRYVRVHEECGNRRTATMSALRNRFPCRWDTVQEVLPDEGRILYRHTGGISKGMAVEWRLRERGGLTEVTITHDMPARFPIVRRAFDDWIVGRLFVHHIAERTLQRIKFLAEAGS